MMNYNIKLISLKTIVFISALFFLIVRPQALKSAQDCNALELMGYAWSENIGWLSFNCTDTGTCASVDYKVTINSTTGKFSGYAWSENIGWIDFGPTSGYPAAPGHEAKLKTSDGTVTGWARACAVFASGCAGALKAPAELGGWDGWLSLSNGSYGITLNDSTNEFEGWAWASDVIGWISFNCLNQGVCAASNYKVTTVFGLVPNPPANLQVNTKAGYVFGPYNVQDPCLASTNCTQTPIPKFAWTPDGDEEEYQIQLDDNSDFSSTLWDSGWVVSSASTDITYAGSALTWDTEYFWRVKTKSCFNESNWSATAKFTANRQPSADFIVSRAMQEENIILTFTSTSIDPDHEAPSGYSEIPGLSGQITVYEWDFNDDGTYEETGQSIQKIYPEQSATILVRHRVTDDGGLKDIASETIGLKYLPQLKTEKGDIYSLNDIKGQNINFDAAYLIQAGGEIVNVTPDNFSKYGDIQFPAGATEYVNALGKIDWQGLSTCTGSPCRNQYGYEVETISNPNQIDNPLAGKIYSRLGDLRINAADLSFNNAFSQKSGSGLVLVAGDLIIEKNITYSDSPASSNPKKLASLGFIVKGDLIIAPAVENLAGAYVIMGADDVGDCALTQISLDPLRYTVPDHCGLVKTGSNLPDAEVPLNIQGLLFARRLFFQRSVKTLTPSDYAEKITYDYRLFLNPPPGMEDFIKALPAWQKVAP